MTAMTMSKPTFSSKASLYIYLQNINHRLTAGRLISTQADEDNLIVQHRQVMMFSQRLSRYSVIVPCKPSHPDIEMSVMIDKDVKVISIFSWFKFLLFLTKFLFFKNNEKADWVYDRHVGFYIDNDFLNSAVNHNLPVYRCLARHPKGFEADNPVYIWQPFKPRKLFIS